MKLAAVLARKLEVVKKQDYAAVLKGATLSEYCEPKPTNGDTAFHVLAHNYSAALVPREFWTQETLGLKNKAQEAVLHFLACSNDLKLVAHLLTSENLSWKKDGGRTPMLVASEYGMIGHIPKHLLVLENLGYIDEYGSSVLRGLARQSQLDLIPDNCKDLNTMIKHGVVAEASFRGCLDQLVNERTILAWDDKVRGRWLRVVEKLKADTAPAPLADNLGMWEKVEELLHRKSVLQDRGTWQSL